MHIVLEHAFCLLIYKKHFSMLYIFSKNMIFNGCLALLSTFIYLTHPLLDIWISVLNVFVEYLCTFFHNEQNEQSEMKLGFPGSWAGKESTCNAGDPSLIPGLGWSPGEGIGLPSPVFLGPWRLRQ